MAYMHHKATYSLGDRELQPIERVIVGTRMGPKEPRRLAKHLGLVSEHPEAIISHRVWDDGEYLPTFRCRESLVRPDFNRFSRSYQGQDGAKRWGYGLEGKVVYIVHTLSNTLSTQDLDKRVEFIADTAKYNGANAVVLIAYTLDHSAQERGVHQTEHQRMQNDSALEKFDGQSPLSQAQLKQYATAGIDAIITPHNHCPEDTKNLCDEVNEELEPLSRRSAENNWTLRYNLDFVHVDLAPMLGYYLSDKGSSSLRFDLSNQGENVLFLCVDQGMYNSGFVQRVREYSGLSKAALAVMKKSRNKDGKGIDVIELAHVEGLSPERGIEGMYVFAPDDVIRSGETMRRNIAALRGVSIDGLERDCRIRGNPARVVAYATRTNFAGNSVSILSSQAIDDLVITNADPRAWKNLGQMDSKTQMIWINFMMAEAAKAVEAGIDPNSILTPTRIRNLDLLKIETSHGHYSASGTSQGGII